MKPLGKQNVDDRQITKNRIFDNLESISHNCPIAEFQRKVHYDLSSSEFFILKVLIFNISYFFFQSYTIPIYIKIKMPQ